MAQWDPFMYWTVAEGGAQFGSAMPAFKDALSKDDIWAVIAYRGAALRRCVRPMRAEQHVSTPRRSIYWGGCLFAVHAARDLPCRRPPFER
jgi:hypothetical protein